MGEVGKRKMVPLGDQAVLVEFGERISPEVHRDELTFCRALEEAGLPGVREWVPAYTSVAVFYDPNVTGFTELAEKLDTLVGKGGGEEEPRRVVTIPVVYGGEWGPDLEEVARLCGLSAIDVVRIHSAPLYRVYMLGFVPGFAYLGGMDERIAVPRLAVPRAKIPAGSVGIAGGQTGVYPLETPGGWRLIGRTPLSLFVPERNPPALLKAGDWVRFLPIAPEDWDRWRERGAIVGEK
jgi:inhibitor of KinA